MLHRGAVFFLLLHMTSPHALFVNQNVSTRDEQKEGSEGAVEGPVA